ncbi:hypothetical protein BGX27_010643 [Mortierella sp. AM989]|nr:hypothetical protein BGX27_010643 [Mortierella sp. AM989]
MSSVEVEAIQKTDKNQPRVCSTLLKKTIRPDLIGQYETIASMFADQQTEITDDISELSILTHKTTLAIASGRLYDKMLEPMSADTFDIRNLLPVDFRFRADIEPILDVAPTPSKLQHHLGTVSEKSCKGDITGLLSGNHLQFMYTQFLSALQRKRQTTTLIYKTNKR